LWSAANEQIGVAKSERVGLTYVQPVMDLLVAAQNQRHAAIAKAPDLSEAQARVSAALVQVEAKHKELGDAFATAEKFETLSKAVRSLAQTPVLATTELTFAAHTTLTDAALSLISAIADGSQLALDPELDTYHLMNLCVVLGPQEMEYLARLRSLGTVTLAMSDTKDVPRERTQMLVRAQALLEYVDAGYESSYKLGVEGFPEVAKTFDMKGTDASREAFLDTVAKQVLITEPKGDASAYLGLGNSAVNTQMALNKQIMARLDSQLQARIFRQQKGFLLELCISIFFVLVAVYLMLAFYKVMMGGLKEVAGHLEQITRGNLTTAPTPWGTDEAAQLMTTMGAMQTSLRSIVSNVLDSAGGVQTASEEIASASQDLSRRTETSASSLQQTASSMEQISATVKHTSDMVAGASAIVRENATTATHGGAVIAQVVTTMEGIRTSSNRIGEIIGVIDGIAFQTNILALNAAVEAARAGEQGRGFAVVASEVRALAGRSAEAAKEIKNLISASIVQVEAANQVVADAGATIQVIVGNAAQIDSIMNEIAVATREQSAGVGQVGSAVHELDRNTQQNAALVEETAAAASALSAQAQRLADEVGFFKMS
jgi:methyl-accepting chemotaxis protein